MLVCSHKVIGFVWFSSFFSDGWIFSGWLLLVLSQSVILIGFWLTLSINWRHNVISWSFTETKLYQHLQKQSHDFNFLIYWRGCKLIASELYKMLNFCCFLILKLRLLFPRWHLLRMSSLTHSGLSKILVPPHGLHHAKVVVAPRNCWEVAFPNFSPAPGGLLGLGQQPVPITCSRELGAGAVGRVKTSSLCLSPPVVC